MVRKNMTNNEIYSIAMQLIEHISQANLCLPIKVNFYLQKNMAAILSIAEDLEKSRNEILNKYGTLNAETGEYNFETDKITEANQELADLFSLEQEVPIYEISLDSFGDLPLDTNQVKAISYMIKEEEE